MSFWFVIASRVQSYKKSVAAQSVFTLFFLKIFETFNLKLFNRF